MKIKCDYCDNTYEDTLEKCPSCGAPNPSHHNAGKPKTIAELQKWYEDRNLPNPEVTRFFIGVDYKAPKAFGIYKDDNGIFIVYKNKSDGSRAIRYQGEDEEYAVNEIYQRLKDEIVHQKANVSNKKTVTRSKKSKIKSFFSDISVILAVIFIILGIIGTIIDFIDSRHNGYYQYNDGIYYIYDSHWYYYDDSYSWTEVSKYEAIPQEIASSYDDYYLSRDWDTSIDATNWNDSSYYEQTHSNDSYDSDYDWGNDDSWDSGGTDWDSDW